MALREPGRPQTSLGSDVVSSNSVETVTGIWGLPVPNTSAYSTTPGALYLDPSLQRWSLDQPWGDVTATYPYFQVTGFGGVPLSTASPLDGQGWFYSSGVGNYVLNATSSLPAGPPSGAAGGDLSGTYPNPSVYQAHLTDQAAPAAPASGTLILAGFNQQGFSVAHLYDTQGNKMEVLRDNMFIARNVTGSTINKGQAVYVSGSTGTVPQVSLAKADSATTLVAVGIMYETTTNNGYGRVMTLGDLENFDLSAFSNGDELYVSASSAGSLTKTAPAYPNFVNQVGVVLNNGVGNGVLGVQIHAAQSNSITNLTGDGTATGPGSVPLTLATVNTTVGSFGSATQVGAFTVNGKGLTTSAWNITISGVAPGGSAGGDLVGTYPNPTVIGINGSSMTLEGTSERMWGPRLSSLSHNVNSTVGNQTAYFVYLGKTVNSITPKFVRFEMDGTVGTTTSCEVGFFSSPTGPSAANKTLTKIVSGNVTVPLTATATNKNASAFGTAISAGTYLWAGFRWNGSVSPQLHGSFDDMDTGNLLTTAASTAFSTTTSYAATTLTQAGGGEQAPLLVGSLD